MSIYDLKDPDGLYDVVDSPESEREISRTEEYVASCSVTLPKKEEKKS